MRWLFAISWLFALSSATKQRQLKEGEIKHFLEVFVYSRAGDKDVQDMFFALTTYNETVSFFEKQLVSMRNGTFFYPKFKLAPLGDSYQIHSFAELADEYIWIFSNNPYEKNVTKSSLQSIHSSFTYRNLIFVDSVKFYKAQDIQLGKTEGLPYTTNPDELFPGYFPNNETLGRIQMECFSSHEITCGINRDTGELEKFNAAKNEVFYMYRAFNFSVPWECGSQFCNFTNLMTGENYEIPPDLKTFIGDAPGKRIAMVPLLTIQSPLVVKQLKRYGKSGAGNGRSWITLVLAFCLRYISV